MKQYISIFVVAITLFGAVSCKSDRFMDPEKQAPDRDEVIYLWAGKAAQEEDNEDGPNKIKYNDGLGISGKDSAGFNMEWEPNDTLYAILWQDADSVKGTNAQATDKYIILESKQTEGGHKMLFQGTGRGGLRISELQGGEHFILVHGHFVLDPNTDGGVFDFPTSEVTKIGYASHIHHGGVINGNDLTFRNQDGTLANLKKHEYMVADSYVRFQKITGKTADGLRDSLIIVPYLGGATGVQDTVPTAGTKEQPDSAKTMSVKMKSAHTLIRLTLLVPDGMFDEIDYRLLAVSLRTESNAPIFHRYFRLHPNTPGIYGPSGWKVDWNDQSDKESNIYFRANLPGTRRYNEINNPADLNFDPTKTVCVAGTGGHYVTLYFSLPSRPLAPDAANGNGIASDTPSKLFVTAFTRTHAYRSIKSYTIGNNSKTHMTKMRPGAIVNLNVSFAGNNIVTKAITDPNLGVTFAPGLIYAVRDNLGDVTTYPWKYKIYGNQGEYAGLDQQTDVFGDYFIFGSIEPRQVFHQRRDSEADTWVNSPFWNASWRQTQPLYFTVDDNGKVIAAQTTDVAALAKVGEYDNIFSTMSKKESDRVWARIQLEAQQGLNRGYYYYDASSHDTDSLRHTAHQAKGAWKPDGKELATDDPRRQMSSTIGIWIGTKTQPSLKDQDKYVFLPSSNQLNNSTNNMDSYEAELTGYEDAEHYRYWASKDYGAQHVKCLTEKEYNKFSDNEKANYVDIPTKRQDTVILHHYYLKSELTGAYSAIMKFSTNTRDLGTGATCERFQVWLNTDKTFHSNSGIKPMDQTFGRVVRPVIY